jgi:hypothetical protein
MIRKAVIVVLTLGAVGVTVIAVAVLRERNTGFCPDALFRSGALFCSITGEGDLYLFISLCPTCGAYGKHIVSCQFASTWPDWSNVPTVLHDHRLGRFHLRVTEHPNSRQYSLWFPKWALWASGVCSECGGCR